MSDRAAVGTARWLLWHALGLVWGVAGALIFRPRVSGAHGLPRDQGYLLLANHSSTFDTPWVAHPLRRPVHFMASADLFRNPAFGAFLRAVNCFPKEVGTKDATSLATVQRLLEAGQVVQIMPEGVRTWDGGLMPVGDGIGRLVKRLGARVVLCRVSTGHLWWPRWARWPRWVPVHIAYDPPRTWTDDATPEAITGDIVAGLAPVPVDLAAERTWAVRTAEGLETYLYGCPVCFALGRMAGERSVLRCGACGVEWRVEVDNRLTSDRAPGWTVGSAYAALRAHLGDPPVADRAAFEADGTALSGDDVEIVQVPRGAPSRRVARGPLRLHAAGLEGHGWTLDFADVLAVNMDAGNVLHLRTATCLWRIVPHGGSTWQWENFVRPWWERRGVGSIHIRISGERSGLP